MLVLRCRIADDYISRMLSVISRSWHLAFPVSARTRPRPLPTLTAPESSMKMSKLCVMHSPGKYPVRCITDPFGIEKFLQRFNLYSFPSGYRGARLGKPIGCHGINTRHTFYVKGIDLSECETKNLKFWTVDWILLYLLLQYLQYPFTVCCW